MGGLRRSLDDVTGLEESLRQANETLREKVTYIETLEQTRTQHDDVIRELTTKCDELEKTLDVTSREEKTVDDEEVSAMREKLRASEVEVEKLSAELAAAREALRVASSANNSSASKAAKEVENEKERHLAEVNDLRATLAQRAAGLERAQAELVRARSNLENEHRKQTELRQKVTFIVDIILC